MTERIEDPSIHNRSPRCPSCEATEDRCDDLRSSLARVSEERRLEWIRAERAEARAESAERKLEEAKAEAAACVEFLRAEMSWEFFRSEMLYAKEDPKSSVSLENARLLQRYLEESGHAKQLLGRLESAERERDALRRFKEYVHRRLDEAGVPVNPDPEGNWKHGCRVEGRLDHVFRERDSLRELLAENDALREALEKYGKHANGCGRWVLSPFSTLGIPKLVENGPCDCGLDKALGDGK